MTDKISSPYVLHVNLNGTINSTNTREHKKTSLVGLSRIISKLNFNFCITNSLDFIIKKTIVYNITIVSITARAFFHILK